jgi:predicted Zn-dependent protease
LGVGGKGDKGGDVMRGDFAQRRRVSGNRPHSRTLAASLIACALLLAGCSDASRFGLGTPATNQRQETAATTPTPQSGAIEREHERILASYGGVYDDPKLQALISRTVDKLVAASEQPNTHYKVTILNSSAINAFALPTGQLYVTRGLIALASDTSELSSVLAHEMAHVIARHAVIRANQAKQAAIVQRVVNDVLSDPEMGALALAKTKLTMASFSRAQEFEADGAGVSIASRAGYDPYGAVRFLTSMERNAEYKSGRGGIDPRSLDFLSSHPANPERIQNARNHARQFSAPGPGARDEETYLAAIDGMVFGEDPNEGFVRGRKFLHPKLGFTFTAPDGFALDNTAQAVVGVRDNGTQAMRFDVVRVPNEQPLTDYLGSGWMDKVDKSSIHDLSINGFSGATATASGDQWQFRIYALRFGDDVYRFIFASKTPLAKSDLMFRFAVNSFRRLTLQEIQAARPLRIKVVTARAGDSASTFARRMAGVERPEHLFRLLNGLGAHDAIKPGDRVKVVVE